MRMQMIWGVQEGRARAVAGENRLQRNSEHLLKFSFDAARLFIWSKEREDESQNIAFWVAGRRFDGNLEILNVMGRRSDKLGHPGRRCLRTNQVSVSRITAHRTLRDVGECLVGSVSCRVH